MVAHVFLTCFACFDSRQWSATYNCGELHLVWRGFGEGVCSQRLTDSCRIQIDNLSSSQRPDWIKNGLMDLWKQRQPPFNERIPKYKAEIDQDNLPQSSSSAWAEDLQLGGWGSGFATRHQGRVPDWHCQVTWVAQDHSRVRPDAMGEVLLMLRRLCSQLAMMMLLLVVFIRGVMRKPRVSSIGARSWRLIWWSRIPVMIVTWCPNTSSTWRHLLTTPLELMNLCSPMGLAVGWRMARWTPFWQMPRATTVVSFASLTMISYLWWWRLGVFWVESIVFQFSVLLFFRRHAGR